MAQAVSRWFLTAEARVRVRVSPCGIYGGQSDTGTGFPQSFLVLPASIILPWLPMLIYHVRDEQYFRW